MDSLRLISASLALAIAAILPACSEPTSNDVPSDASSTLGDAATNHVEDGGHSSSDAALRSTLDGTFDGSSDATLPPGTPDADATSPPSTCVEQRMGPAGGTMDHPNGAKIVVPVGALAAATQLSLCSSAPPASSALGAQALGQTYEAGPEGQTFLKPVEVVIPVDAARVAAASNLAAIQMRMAPENTTNFSALQSSFDLVAGTASALTTHFTQFAVGQTANPVFISTSPSLPQGTVGVAYSQAFAASGGTPPYTWSAAASSMVPPGLSLSATGTLSGMPTIPSNFAFFVVVSDAANDAVQMAVSLTVLPPNNPAPTLASVTPSTIAQGSGDTVISLSGTGFVPNTAVMWDGTALATTFVGATQAAASIPASDLLTAGSHMISVVNPAPGGGTSGTVAFSITPATLNPVPSIVSVTPTQLPISTVDTQIAITGSNFIASTTAVIGSQPIATSIMSATQAQAIVPAAYLSAAGTLAIGVSTPPPGGGPSATIAVTVGTPTPPPVLTLLSPSSVPAGSGAFTLSLSFGGDPSNISNIFGAQAFFGSTALSTTYNGWNAPLTTQVPANLVANRGNVQVVLVGPSGGGVSQPLTFFVSPPAGELPDAGPPLPIAANQSACAALSSGQVKCWGYGAGGVMGNGATSQAQCDAVGSAAIDECFPTPVTVSNLSGVTALAAGDGANCALLSGGTVECWGRNETGLLGVDPAGPDGGAAPDNCPPEPCDSPCTTSVPCSKTPTAVPGLSGVTGISVGLAVACALLSDGTVDCWGNNDWGGLGRPLSLVSASTPVAVPGLSGVTAIASGTGHNCALLSGGTVECWGLAADLGTSTSSEQCSGQACSTTPVPVSGLSQVQAIAAGGDGTCALLLGGTVQCWPTSAAGSPAAIVGLTGAISIAVNGANGCAVKADGTVACWGPNASGQLGNGTAPIQMVRGNTPQCADPSSCITAGPVSNLSGVTGIAVGGDFACASLSGGPIECWGGNEDGDLGIGTTTGPDQCELAVGPCSMIPVAVAF